jgi:hypothetical protein
MKYWRTIAAAPAMTGAAMDVPCSSSCGAPKQVTEGVASVQIKQTH